jgi:hypothetical protein
MGTIVIDAIVLITWGIVSGTHQYDARPLIAIVIA